MAAMTELFNQVGAVAMGQNGRILEWVSFTWPGTGATGTIKSKLKVVENVIYTHNAAPASDEIGYWSDTKNADGTFRPGTDGLITIGRTGASKTSNLAGQALLIGY